MLWDRAENERAKNRPRAQKNRHAGAARNREKPPRRSAEMSEMSEMSEFALKGDPQKTV